MKTAYFKKIAALFLGFVLIFSVFGICGVLPVNAEGTDYALQVVASQQYAQLYKVLNVDTDTDYIVKLDVKSFVKTNTQLRVYTGSGTGGTRLVAQMLSGDDWTTVTYEFNSGSNTRVTLAFVTTVLDETAHTLIDNVSIYKNAAETAVIYEGDFASGSLTDYTAASGLIGTVFNVYTKEENDTEEGEKVDYALQVVASQQYAQLYKVLNVDTDTDYIVKLDAKSFVKTNTQLRVYTGSGTGGTRLVAQMLSGEDWTTVTYEFNSGSNTQVTLAFVTTVLDETAHTLIDNISIYKKADETAVIYKEDFASGSLTDYTAASGLIGTVFNVYAKEEGGTEGEKVDYALQVYSEQQYKQLYQVFNVDASTDYVVKLDFKSNGTTNTQMRVYMGMGLGSTTHKINLQDSVWTTTSYEFTTDENTQQITLSFMTTSTDKSAYTWIDNISIYKKLDETAVIYEEDFASGSLTGFISAENDLSEKVFNVRNKDEYDYNADGTVNICDLVIVAEYVLDPNSNTKISLAADNDGTIEEADIATTRTVLLERY